MFSFFRCLKGLHTSQNFEFYYVTFGKISDTIFSLLNNRQLFFLLTGTAEGKGGGWGALAPPIIFDMSFLYIAHIVITICKLLLVNPATSASGERSFSTALRIKTCHPVNHLFIIHGNFMAIK